MEEKRNMLVSIRRPPISMYSALEYLIWGGREEEAHIVGAAPLPANAAFRLLRAYGSS